jgi:hypothetical protein
MGVRRGGSVLRGGARHRSVQRARKRWAITHGFYEGSFDCLGRDENHRWATSKSVAYLFHITVMG